MEYGQATYGETYSGIPKSRFYNWYRSVTLGFPFVTARESG